MFPKSVSDYPFSFLLPLNFSTVFAKTHCSENKSFVMSQRTRIPHLLSAYTLSQGFSLPTITAFIAFQTSERFNKHQY